MRRFPDHAALVVSLTALVVALGGTAVASNYVITSSGQIKDGAVASADVRDSSLTGADLKDGSVASADVRNGALTGADVKDHSLSPKDFSGSVAGPMGPQGPAGQKGETGAAGPSDTYTGYSPSGGILSPAPPRALVAGTTTPPGSYVLQANAVVTNKAATGEEVECQLWAGSDVVDVAYVTLDAPGGLDTQTLALTGTDTVGLSANLISFVCSGNFSYVDADVIATRVGTLH